MKLRDIVDRLNTEVKMKPAEDWDNSGLQIGSMNAEVNRVIVAMDMSKEVLRQAVDEKAQMIVTHHPFLFRGIKSIDLDTYDGNIIKGLIDGNISLYSIHTCYDMADEGVNSILGDSLGFSDSTLLHDMGEGYGYGGVADITPVTTEELALHVKEKLNLKSIKLYCQEREAKVNRVAYCGGSGADFIYDAMSKGADVYVTGDIKYHEAQSALKLGLSIIDAGHFATEYPSLKPLCHFLTQIGLEATLYRGDMVGGITL